MKPIKGPRAGSRAHSVLAYLQAAKGEATQAALARVVAWLGSPRSFDEEIIAPLVREEFVSKRGGSVVLSKRGALLLNPPAPKGPKEVDVVKGRYVAPQRPLSTQNRPRLVSMRPGALDYREIPSRMGDQWVQHGQKAAA